jgi:sigma-B regulation protein RsbU (phosphoserine phosphatase)
MNTLIAAIIIGGSLATLALALLAYRAGRRRAKERLRELTQLNEIGQRLLRAQLDVDELCELVYWQVGQVIDTSLFQLGLFDGDAYLVKIWVRDDERLEQGIFAEGGKRGIVGWVHSTGKPMLVRDFRTERERLPAFPQFQIDSPPRSGLFVPLIAGERTIGIIAVQNRKPNAFSEKDLQILTMIANQTASVIRNAQLYQSASHRAEHLRLLSDVVQEVQSIQPLPDLFHQIVTLTQEKFGYYNVGIFIRDGDVLRLGASTKPTADVGPTEIATNAGMISWAAAKGETAIANDVTQDSRYVHLSTLPDTRSEIALPLMIEENVLGVLDVQSTDAGAFGKEDVFVLETLANQVAIAIEQAKAYEAEASLAQRLEMLSQASRAVVSMLDLDGLLEEVVDLIEDLFGFERAHIFLQIGERLIFRAGSGAHSERWLIEGLSYAQDDEGIIPWVGRMGKPMHSDDVSQDPLYRPGSGVEDTRSELAVPIIMADRVMGVIDVQSRVVNAFDEEDERLMQALADTVAVAIRNAALYTSERRRRVLAESLREIGGALTSNLDLERVLADILSGLERVVELEAAAILLREDSEDMLRVAATTGQQTSQDSLGQTFPLKNEPGSYHMVLGLPEQHACLEVPLEAGSELVGYLIVEDSRQDDYRAEDREIVMAFGSQAAVAIENARLYAAQQAEAWMTTVLLQVAEAINQSATSAETLATVARLTPLLAGVRSCMILSRSPLNGRYIPEAEYGIDAEYAQAFQANPPSASDAPFWELLNVADFPLGAGKGHALPIPDAVAEAFRAEAVLGIPLIAQNEQMGVMIVDDPWHGEPPDPRLHNILMGIANQTGLALNNATLQMVAREQEQMERELEVAREIQGSLMPDCCPVIPGWELAAAWRAARRVGGDFYDFIQLSDGLWGLVIADVADKGVPAALFMAMSRTLLRAVAINRKAAASTLLRLNELLRNDSWSDLFVTMFYAVWNPETGRIVYANAGHNPPLLVNVQSGEIKQLKGKGIALGVLSDIVIEEYYAKMAPGDVLLAYTDGITEAMQVDYVEWGLPSLEETLSGLYSHSAGEILDGVLDAVNEFVGDAPQSDDLTLWVLRRRPE